MNSFMVGASAGPGFRVVEALWDDPGARRYRAELAPGRDVLAPALRPQPGGRPDMAELRDRLAALAG